MHPMFTSILNAHGVGPAPVREIEPTFAAGIDSNERCSTCHRWMHIREPGEWWKQEGTCHEAGGTTYGDDCCRRWTAIRWDD